MPSGFDISKFFDKEAFSDITITFGSKQLRCHKIILCTKSTYFEKLIGPGTAFAESNQASVELKEDDEEAVQAMLRWLYSFDYESEETKKTNQFDFHANVCVVADKYGLPQLRNKAFKRLVAHIRGTEDGELVEVIGKVKQPSAGYVHEIHEVVQKVRDDRLPALLKNDTFRAMLESDPKECMALIDKLGFAMGLEEKTYVKCGNCNHGNVRPSTAESIILHCNICRCALTQPMRKACWVKES